MIFHDLLSILISCLQNVHITLNCVTPYFLIIGCTVDKSSSAFTTVNYWGGGSVCYGLSCNPMTANGCNKKKLNSELIQVSYLISKGILVSFQGDDGPSHLILYVGIAPMKAIKLC